MLVCMYCNGMCSLIRTTLLGCGHSVTEDHFQCVAMGCGHTHSVGAIAFSRSVYLSVCVCMYVIGFERTHLPYTQEEDILFTITR